MPARNASSTSSPLREAKMPEPPKIFDVGYGKPPESTRFKKGQSGNPRGRPRGRKNWVTQAERILNEKVVINESGRRTTVTKFEAAVKQLVNKAASGDHRAIQALLALQRSINMPGGKMAGSFVKLVIEG